MESIKNNNLWMDQSEHHNSKLNVLASYSHCAVILAAPPTPQIMVTEATGKWMCKAGMVKISTKTPPAAVLGHALIFIPED